MGALFEFIFSNPIFAFLLIMGLISFFNRLAKGEEQQSETSTNEQQRQPTRRQSHNRTGQERYSPSREIDESDSLTFREQRDMQMEQLAGQMNTSLNVDEELEDLAKARNISRPINEQKDDKKSKEQLKMQRRVKQRLTRQGLIDSIVMAEVLGRPRALEPYSNIVTRKRRK